MIKQNFRIAWRNLLHNKQYSLVNLAGLSLSITAFCLVMLYVQYERSFDNFQGQKENLYRVNYKQWLSGKLEVDNAAAVPAVGPAMKENFPEVTDYCRLTATPSSVVNYQDRNFREEKIRVADPSFLKIFSFPLVKGNAGTALTAPNTAVITELTAKKYFGDTDPLGKVITLDGRRHFEITGVCRNVPANSTIKFDFLLSMEQYFGSKQQNAGWYWYDFYTYVVLKPGTDQQIFQSKFNKWLGEKMKQEWKDQGLFQEFTLQPIVQLHLNSHRMQELEPAEQRDGRMVSFLFVIGLLIVAIAWSNYINLTTCRFIKRAKEIGVKKVMGATRPQLMGQFLAESFLVNGLAAIIAVWMLNTAIPWFEGLIGHRLPIQPATFIIMIISLVVVGTLVAGIYPALVLIRFQPAKVLKGHLTAAINGYRLRQSLVVFQFSISIVLIIGAFTIFRQINFIRSKDLGVRIDQILVVNSPKITGADSLYTASLETFKTELQKLSIVQQVTLSSSVPGREIDWMNTITPVQDNEEIPNAKNNKAIFIVGVDSFYFGAYGIHLLAGHDFSSGSNSGKEDLVMLNQSAVQLLGYAGPAQSIGQRVNFRGRDRTIIGITTNYNHVSPKEAVTPIVFTYQPAGKGYFSIKMNTEQTSVSISRVAKLYQHFFSGNPFDYYFLDDAFDQQFRADLQFGKLVGAFTGLAIFVACLGLFALSAFAAEQRTKEIGIRKVLGAGSFYLVGLLSKDFLKLVVIANFIALPVGWWAMKNWLQDFAYRIQLGTGIFVLAGFSAVLIAWFTVSFQAVKSARANPVKALRNE